MVNVNKAMPKFAILFFKVKSTDCTLEAMSFYTLLPCDDITFISVYNNGFLCSLEYLIRIIKRFIIEVGIIHFIKNRKNIFKNFASQGTRTLRNVFKTVRL